MGVEKVEVSLVYECGGLSALSWCLRAVQNLEYLSQAGTGLVKQGALPVESGFLCHPPARGKSVCEWGGIGLAELRLGLDPALDCTARWRR